MYITTHTNDKRDESLKNPNATQKCMIILRFITGRFSVFFVVVVVIANNILIILPREKNPKTCTTITVFCYDNAQMLSSGVRQATNYRSLNKSINHAYKQHRYVAKYFEE